MADGPPRKPRFAWRPLVRAWHRDLGYLLVGLTFVYAVSGIAVNHVADWDPNFQSYRKTHRLPPNPAADDAALTADVLRRLAIRAEPREVYRASRERFDITLPDRTLHVNPVTGSVVEQGQKPRLLLRLANWLHLNRGKKAWTLIADLYAGGLLLLAVSGLFMLPGKNGLRGRGAVLVTLGVAVPVLYVLLSGGPAR
jgi:hypothetical protein